MKIQLDLTKHCIETALKRRHDRLISQYFKQKGNDLEIENQIEKIQSMLTSLDFSFLRSRYQDLAGNSQKSVVLSVDEKGKIDILIDGEAIRH